MRNMGPQHVGRAGSVLLLLALHCRAISSLRVPRCLPNVWTGDGSLATFITVLSWENACQVRNSWCTDEPCKWTRTFLAWTALKWGPCASGSQVIMAFADDSNVNFLGAGQDKYNSLLLKFLTKSQLGKHFSQHTLNWSISSFQLSDHLIPHSSCKERQHWKCLEMQFTLRPLLCGWVIECQRKAKEELPNIDGRGLGPTRRAITSLFFWLPPWEWREFERQEAGTSPSRIQVFLGRVCQGLLLLGDWDVGEMRPLSARASVLTHCSAEIPRLGRTLWAPDLRMGNAAEKQKPRKRSRLCPWKQGKQALGFVSRRKEVALHWDILAQNQSWNCSGNTFHARKLCRSA